jgi:hypothetical protein
MAVDISGRRVPVEGVADVSRLDIAGMATLAVEWGRARSGILANTRCPIIVCDMVIPAVRREISMKCPALHERQSAIRRELRPSARPLCDSRNERRWRE